MMVLQFYGFSNVVVQGNWLPVPPWSQNWGFRALSGEKYDTISQLHRRCSSWIHKIVYLRIRRSNLTADWSLLWLIALHKQKYPLWMSRLCQMIQLLVKRLLFITLFLLFFLILIVSNYLHIPSLCFTLQDGFPQWRGAQWEGGGGDEGGDGVGGEETLPTTATINGQWQWQHTTIK